MLHDGQVQVGQARLLREVGVVVGLEDAARWPTCT